MNAKRTRPNATSIESLHESRFEIIPSRLSSTAHPCFADVGETALSALKKLVKRILAPYFFRRHDRATGKRMEVTFWDGWIAQLAANDDLQRRLDPTSPITDEHHLEVLATRFRPDMTVLDVGSGPITGMGYTHRGVALDITACDPNADEYASVLAKHKLSPPVVTVFARGEELSTSFDRHFSWINCDNALDHMADPAAVLTQMVKLLEPGGAISLRHWIDEGRNEGYRGYHKWNISPLGRDGFRIWNPEHEHRFEGTYEGLDIAVEVDQDGTRIAIILSDGRPGPAG